MSSVLTERISTLQSILASCRRRCSEYRGQAKLFREQQSRLLRSAETQLAQVELSGKALEILLLLEKTWRGRYEAGLAGLGSQGLNAVFTSDTYEVLLESNVKRGVSNLDIVLVKNGERVRLKGGSGGSVVQVLAYLLRHLTTASHRPALRPLLALDEPFSMVNVEQRPALCALVKEITQRLGFQMLFSSHEDELADAADVVVLIHPGGKVEQLKSATEERA